MESYIHGLQLIFIFLSIWMKTFLCIQHIVYQHFSTEKHKIIRNLNNLEYCSIFLRDNNQYSASD